MEDQGATGVPITGVLTGEAIPRKVVIVNGPLPPGAPGPPLETQMFPAESMAIPAGPAIWSFSISPDRDFSLC